MSVSLDGFYAGPTSPDTDIHNWMGSEEALGFFRITRWVVDAMGGRERQGLEGGEDDTNSEILREGFESAGAYLMGRRMFDGGEQPWGDEPPFRAPVFVVTHRSKETVVKQGGTSFTFVTDGIEAAAERARGIPADQALELTPTRVVATPEVTHIRYTLDGRSQLVVDDRISAESAG